MKEDGMRFREGRMRKAIVLTLAGIMTLILIGCGGIAKDIQGKDNSLRADVFSEIKNSNPSSPSEVALLIKASIKTHVANYYAFESSDSLHGKPGYPFLVSIDGQAEIYKVDGQKEVTPLYDKDGHTSRDPEAGEGVKYILEKRIALRPGSHDVLLGLPEDDYFKEVTITLKEGYSYTMEFNPIYKYKTFPARITTFKRGIKDLETILKESSCEM
jgi:hypothetical protein